MNTTTLNIDERRKLLREALANADANDISGFAAALGDASEADRAVLSRTLPATKLFKAEGPTPRACYALAALGKPGTIVEMITPMDSGAVMEHLLAADTIKDAMSAAAQGRDRTWQLAFIDALADEGGYSLTWLIIRALIKTCGLAPDSEEYLRRFLTEVTGVTWERNGGGKTWNSPEQIAALLCESDGALLTEFWALFRVEGMSGYYYLTGDEDCATAWLSAIAILCDTVPGFRDRILDESLGALLRDFSAKNILWYPRVHHALDPTPDEVFARASRYEALFTTEPSTAVGLAQDMLARVIDRIDPAAFLDASASVLNRREKKLLTAQIKLLAALVKAHPGYAAQVSELLASVMETLPPDVVIAARKLMQTEQHDAPAPAAKPELAGTPVAIPEPRRAAIAHEPDQLEPIADEDELWELVSAGLEGVGNGRDLPRILDYLGNHADLAVRQPILARATEIMETVGDWMNASPRRHLADLLIARAARQPRRIAYGGYMRRIVLARGEIAPDGMFVERGGKLVECGGQRDIYAGYQFVRTCAPMALLVGQFRAGAGQVAFEPLPAAICEWSRAMLSSGRGRESSYITPKGEPKPVWQTSDTIYTKHDFGVGGTQEEYTLRAEESREQDGFEQIVQWAAWLLSENPDILAAIYHPVFDAAVRVGNVRGIGVLLAALGATRQVPQGPTWSALALGLSAKTAEHRAAAAEAVAALAQSGLLDPAPFAAEIAAHLRDGFALAGRLTLAFADAASINAIAGYRVLQTLAALLPHLDGVNQSAKLIELAAKLSADYGTPIAIPETLASKRKGASVMAVALRALDAVTPRPTTLAENAAAQARNAE